MRNSLLPAPTAPTPYLGGPRAEERRAAFLADLTDLAVRHGLAIGGAPRVVVMGREDITSSYSVDGDGRLLFGGPGGEAP